MGCPFWSSPPGTVPTPSIKPRQWMMGNKSISQPEAFWHQEKDTWGRDGTCQRNEDGRAKTAGKCFLETGEGSKNLTDLDSHTDTGS